MYLQGVFFQLNKRKKIIIEVGRYKVISGLFFPMVIFNFLTGLFQKYIPNCNLYIQVGLDIENFCGKYRTQHEMLLEFAASDPPTAAGDKWETIKFTRGEIGILSTTTFRQCFQSNSFYSGRLKTPCRGRRLYFLLEIFRFSCIINYWVECFGST